MEILREVEGHVSVLIKFSQFVMYKFGNEISKINNFGLRSAQINNIANKRVRDVPSKRSFRS